MAAKLSERNDSPAAASCFALSIQVVKICCGSAHFAPKRIIVPLIQSADVIAAKTLVSDLHPGAERTHRRKIFDRKADGFRGRGKATIAQARKGLLLSTSLAFFIQNMPERSFERRILESISGLIQSLRLNTLARQQSCISHLTEGETCRERWHRQDRRA